MGEGSEAAGALAAWTLDRQLSPERVWRKPEQLRRFQSSLLEEGIPVAWITDVPVSDSAFASVQSLFMSNKQLRAEGMTFRPDEPIKPRDWLAWGGEGDAPATRRAAANLLESTAREQLKAPSGSSRREVESDRIPRRP